MKSISAAFVLLACSLFVPCSLRMSAATGADADQKAPAAGAEQSKPSPFPAPPAEEKTVNTQHTIRIGGKELHYTATTGTLVIKKDDGKPLASMFFIAYTQDGADLAKRPVTFTFNGGPGSSSVWLHMGALGPRRVALGPEGAPVPPPYHLVDNEQTALGFTDLVFIDPVTTGFSRNAPGEDPKQFHGFEGDLSSVGEFIRLYIAHYGRWGSPKFLAGESYGTTRASALSEYLLKHDGIYLNGITLVSSVLNFQTLDAAPGNDLPYIEFLPSFTATAWYHKKLGADLQSGSLEHAVDEARKFSSGPYSLALMKGDELSESERKQTAAQVARLTGLSEDFIMRSNLRVSDTRFFKELLRDRNRTVGRYDSRLLGVDEDSAGETADYDPSYSAVQGAFTAAFGQYIRSELNWQSDMPYEILTSKVWPWNYSTFTGKYVEVADRLRSAISQNQNMKVMIANGYYDLATPFFATEYTVHHLALDPKLRGNISMMYCEAGHMLYTRTSCLESLHRHMGELYRNSLP
jgi:carboxypeptidase C (cathepsin A)